jgi:hypothetical protein
MLWWRGAMCCFCCCSICLDLGYFVLTFAWWQVAILIGSQSTSWQFLPVEGDANHESSICSSCGFFIFLKHAFFLFISLPNLQLSVSCEPSMIAWETEKYRMMEVPHFQWCLSLPAAHTSIVPPYLWLSFHRSSNCRWKLFVSVLNMYRLFLILQTIQNTNFAYYLCDIRYYK